MSRTPLLLGALLLTACVANRTGGGLKSSTPSAEQVDPARAATGDKLICTMERPTGSNLPEQVCRWASDRQAASDEARDALHPRPIQHHTD